MFDEVTKQEGGKRVARRGAFLAGSTVAQILFVAFLIVAGERIRAAVKSEPVVEVKFVKTAPPRPPPPPPAPPARKPPQDRPKTEVKKSPPMAMIQPKTVQEEIKPPDPNEPEEDYEGGEEGGVIGGVAGGAGQAPAGQHTVEEAPRYVTTGFKPPKLASRTCLSENMKLPPELMEMVSGPVTVKFAVYSNGAVGSIQILTALPDPRISEAIKRAISNCEWVPGADAQGKATALWVIQPFRFAD
ncbi:MAG TPA: energy transducer TonB [Anaeromyxobacteraceae bacterium]|nr:energy transducer TonB [Anaeromyxobacteraceae bacterium]